MFLKVKWGDGTTGEYAVNYGSTIQIFDSEHGVQASFGLTGVETLELSLDELQVHEAGDFVESTPEPAVGPETHVEPAEVTTPGVSPAAGGDDTTAASAASPSAPVTPAEPEPIPAFPPVEAEDVETETPVDETATESTPEPAEAGTDHSETAVPAVEDRPEATATEPDAAS